MSNSSKMKPLNVKYITGNIKSVFKNNDIRKLKRSVYNHIIQRMGFIAHYDLNGFQCVYDNLEKFAQKLLTSEMNSDLSCTLYHHAKYYINDNYFSSEYGDEVVKSWYDTIIGIRKHAIDYLIKNSGDKILINKLELLEDNTLNEYTG